MGDVFYIEVNNWFSGRDYPIDGILKQCVENHLFSKDEWCRDNKLCVVAGNIDMSANWCITAPRKWVEDNCPELLGDDTYIYTTITHSKEGQKYNEHEKKYSSFLKQEDELGRAFGNFGWRFLDYTEDNFGVTYIEEDEEE